MRKQLCFRVRLFSHQNSNNEYGRKNNLGNIHKKVLPAALDTVPKQSVGPQLTSKSTMNKEQVSKSIKEEIELSVKN